MKKTILTIALALGLTAGAFAQTRVAPRNTSNDCPAASTCRQQNPNQQERCNPFEGLQLTAEQQAAIDSLQSQCRRDNRDRRANNREAMQEDRRAMLGRIKQILTPEQYVTFLENSFVNGAKMQQSRPNARHQMRREARRTAQPAAPAAAQPAATPAN